MRDANSLQFEAVPSILHVCREARQIGLKSYVDLRDKDYSFYFDASIDFVLVKPGDMDWWDEEFKCRMPSSIRHTLQHVLFTDDFLQTYKRTTGATQKEAFIVAGTAFTELKTLNKLPALKTVNLSHNHGERPLQDWISCKATPEHKEDEYYDKWWLSTDIDDYFEIIELRFITAIWREKEDHEASRQPAQIGLDSEMVPSERPASSIEDAPTTHKAVGGSEADAKHTDCSEHEATEIFESVMQSFKNIIQPSEDMAELKKAQAEEPAGTQTPPQLVQSFTMFQQLPAELQHEIWRLSMTPRAIQFGTRDYPFPSLEFDPVPAILHTNHESRTIGLKHYQVFDSELEHQRLTKSYYFNADIDFLSLSQYEWEEFYDLSFEPENAYPGPAALQNVLQHIMIPSETISKYCRSCGETWWGMEELIYRIFTDQKDFNLMPALKSVSLVENDGERDLRDMVDTVYSLEGSCRSDYVSRGARNTNFDYGWLTAIWKRR